MWLPFW